MWRLYLDESGDLGFDFQNKKPSPFLTIAILATYNRGAATKIDQAVRRTLRRKVNRKKMNKKLELKGADSTIAVKRYFYRQIRDLEFGIYALTLNKIRVKHELRNRPDAKERLYNFIAREVMEKIPF